MITPKRDSVTLTTLKISTTHLRFFFNFGMVVGQGLILYLPPEQLIVGLTLKIICNCILTVVVLKQKMYDFVIVLSAFNILEISRFVTEVL